MQKERRERQQKSADGDDEESEQRNEVMGDVSSRRSRTVPQPLPQEVTNPRDNEQRGEVEPAKDNPANDTGGVETDGPETPDTHVISGPWRDSAVKGEPSPDKRDGGEHGQQATPEEELTSDPVSGQADA
ncbi:hypothetical protein GCM10012285_50620 [Streptomyces kronopolitis]|uniref:Uncharacterized protein n=1 Tax=Streptomyces kronopolitis TaxID=1612435 RepID=A0ABQ2JXX2_9ACTN|nr:hypothetical protein GCM10012285_50620 [Streptomyces kronopolitis]